MISPFDTTDAEEVIRNLLNPGVLIRSHYVDVLMAIFRDRLRFLSEFIGRGDMSRGGLMLRCAMDRQELSYVAIAGAIVNGKRSPKLAPRSYASADHPLTPKAHSHPSLGHRPRDSMRATSQRFKRESAGSESRFQR